MCGSAEDFPEKFQNKVALLARDWLSWVFEQPSVRGDCSPLQPRYCFITYER